MIPVQHVHPMIVHFPIVLILLVAAFELGATILGRDVTGRSATGNVAVVTIAIAALAAIAAYYFGDIALSYAESGGFESDVAEVHESLGKMVALTVSAWAIVRGVLWVRDVRLPRPFAYAIPVVSIAGAALVTWTAYYGGQLVFDLGVNVSKVTLGS